MASSRLGRRRGSSPTGTAAALVSAGAAMASFLWSRRSDIGEVPKVLGPPEGQTVYGSRPAGGNLAPHSTRSNPSHAPFAL